MGELPPDERTNSEPTEPTVASEQDRFKVPIYKPLQLSAELRGRCISCAYLAVAPGPMDEPVAKAISRFVRESGRLSNWMTFCFRQEADLTGELAAASVGYVDREVAARQVLGSERNCPAWYEYQAGLSPRETLEEQRMMQIEEARNAHDLQLAQMQADAQASVAKIQADSLEIAKAIKASSEATQRFTSRWTYVAVTLAALAVVGTIVGATFTALSFFHQAPTPTIRLVLPTPLTTPPSPTR